MQLNTKKLVQLTIVLLLVVVTAGCFQAQEFAVIDSNLADYQETGVTPKTDKVNLEFTHNLADVEVKLIKNDNETVDTEVAQNGKELVISDFELEPITNYQLTIKAKDEQGQEVVNEYQFITDPNSYPQVENKNKTLLQAFYWEMGKKEYAEKYPGEKNLWTLLSDRAAELSDLGITSLWLPPAHKAHNLEDEGYAVYDLWDLGEFDQQGTVRTKYGTKAELEKAVSDLQEEGLEVYYDAVLNQRIAERGDEKNIEEVPLKGGGTIKAYTNFSPLKGRQEYYSQADEFEWNWQAFDGAMYGEDKGVINPKRFKDKSWDDTYGSDFLSLKNDPVTVDVDYQNEDVQHEMKEWGQWIVNEIGFDGFRLDAVKHIDNNFMNQWITSIQESSDKDVFFVGEAWIDDKMGLSFYLSGLGNQDATVFDFPLRQSFKALSSGSINMSALSNSGLVNDPNHGDRAVTFVDNHDTGRDVTEYNSPISNRKMQAYSYILTREKGKPMVFWKDYYQNGYQEELTRLLEARRYYAYGPGREVNNNGNGVYSYVREGLEDKPQTGLVMMISSETSGEVVTRKIKTTKPNTTFYDYSRNIKESVTTDEDGYAEFKVRKSEASGWSIWVPSKK